MLLEGFQKIFWGLFLVFFEFHVIVVDILPDPIGYYLVFSGLNILTNHFAVSKTQKNRNRFAIVLLVISIPTVFIANFSLEQMGNASVFSQWWLYINVIGLLNVILAYNIFELMMVITIKKGLSQLQKRTSNIFNIYMLSMILITFFQSFVMNMTRDWLTGYSIISAIIGFLLQLIFLALISHFSKLPDDGEGIFIEVKGDQESPIS